MKTARKVGKSVIFQNLLRREKYINWKSLIWSKDKIITKFGKKKWSSLVLVKVYENCPEIKEKCYFTKPK